MSMNKYYIFKSIQFISVLLIVVGFQQFLGIQQDLFDVVIKVGSLIIALSIITGILLFLVPHVWGKFILAIIAVLVILACFSPVESLIHDYLFALCINVLVFLLEIYALKLLVKGLTS